MNTHDTTCDRPPISVDTAMQAAYEAGRATVLHALVHGLLATQRLREAEVSAFFKTVRDALAEELTNTRRVQSALQDAGFENPGDIRVLGAFRGAIELQMRLIEMEITEAATRWCPAREPPTKRSPAPK